MKKEFVPYRLSLELRELGFNEKCLRLYVNEQLAVRPYDESNRVIEAPLWQQAFDWFRAKYALEGFITPLIDETGYVQTYECRTHKEGYSIHIVGCFEKYENALDSCLEKLIQIVKDENRN